MTKPLIYLLLIFTALSCGHESSDLYKTQTGEFASKTGKFIADFPSKPSYTAIDNQIGMDKFQIHLFRNSLGKQNMFSVEYTDYPEYTVKSLADEQLYANGVTNFVHKMASTFNLHFQEPIKQHGMKGQAFQLEPNTKAKDQGLDSFIIGRIFRKNNRVYTVTYIGIGNQHVDGFLNSFRLL